MDNEWAFNIFMAAAGLCFLGFAVMLGGIGWLNVECYRSGDPDSMACYMTNGKTQRVKADVSVK